jgi:serine/threonine protein kinase
VDGSRDPGAPTADVDRLVDGRYRLEEVIGVGGMATVHRALDLKVDRIVAIKLLRREMLADEDLAMRFRREALAATVLRHPNIIGCLEAGTDDGQPYLVMELVDGEDLAARLRRDGRLPADEVVRIGSDIARALGVAHVRGIVHRDVKPGNIVLARDGRAMITDFGIARLAADAEGAVPGTTLGSVHYFSPEQALGRTTTPASDVYGLGLVLYEAVTGRRAWGGATSAEIASVRVGHAAPSPRAVRPDIPFDLDAIVVRALDPDPERRYQNGNALAVALEPLAHTPLETATRLVPHVQPPARPVTRSVVRTRPARRYAPAIAAPLAVLGIVATVVMGALLIAALPGPGGGLGVAFASPRPSASTRASQRPAADPAASVIPAIASGLPPTATATSRPPSGRLPDLCEPFFGFSCGIGPGKIESTVFRPTTRFVLGDGWSAAGVAPELVSLERPEGVVTLASGIDAVFPNRDERQERPAPTTARGMIESFIGTDAVAAKRPHDRLVDGRTAVRVNLTPIGRERVALFKSADQVFYLEPGGPTRVIVVDGPTGPVIIAIESSPDATLGSILPTAQAVIRSIHFR